jgi:multicomponent Na+:H+ antiporter subunit D
LHIWLTNAYATAPTFVSVFLSATATKVGIYGLFRVIFTLFGTSLAFDSLPLEEILTILSVLAILIGSFCALMQKEIRRMLAFSSVAHVGYMLLAVTATGTAIGLQASLLHMAAHAMAKSALFMGAGALILCHGGHRLEDIAGTGRTMPWTVTGFALAALSLIGIPGTLGFISKWYLLKALLDQGSWLLIGVILLSSVMAVIYIWRVIEAAFFTKNTHVKAPVKEAPLTILLPLWLLSLSGIVFGLYPQALIDFTQAAAKLFF